MNRRLSNNGDYPSLCHHYINTDIKSVSPTIHNSDSFLMAPVRLLTVDCDEHTPIKNHYLILTDTFSSGKDTGIPNFGRPENEMTEERIAQILNEASQLQMKSHIVEDSHSNEDSKSPHGQCSSPFSKDSSQNRRLKKYENDDIPQEKVVRIYQEELAKLMGRRLEDMRNPIPG